MTSNFLFWFALVISVGPSLVIYFLSFGMEDRRD